MIEAIRDLFAPIPDAGSRNPQTPPIPYYGTLIPSNSVFFCRLARSHIYRQRNRIHVGNRYVYGRILETSGSIRVNGVSYKLTPDDAFLICPHQIHGYEEIEAERVTWLFWAFNVDGGSSELDALGERPLKASPEIDQMLLSLSKEYLQTSPSMIAESNALNLRCSILLDRILSINSMGIASKNQKAGIEHFDHLLKAINDYISENLDESITLPELARAVGYSESHLRRLFKQRVDVSLGKYIREIRLKRSVAMVISTDRSMTEIAFDCGYKSLSTFYRIFHDCIGCAPREFRMKHRNKQLSIKELNRISKLSAG